MKSGISLIVVVAFIIILPVTGVLAFDPLFDAALTFGAGEGPQSVTTGDFNEDGHTDLAVANTMSNDVSILLGLGDGTFASAVNYGTGDYPHSVTTGDFDEDGHTDLAVANEYTADVSILLGLGDGTFASAVSYGAGDGALSVTTGDFDEDGHTDLAVANASSEDVSILIGAGDGTFASAVNYGVGDSPRSVTTGDFNEDCHMDLAVANYGSYGGPDSVSVLLGAGDGTFASAVNYGVGEDKDPASVTTGDFDEDGHTDLAVANEYSNDVSILLGLGDGTFASAVNYGVGDHPTSVTTGDFNEDGHTDLAVANGGSDDVSILLGRLGVGGGIFAPALNYDIGYDPWSVTTGDFYEDGHTDLATANMYSDNVSILLGAGDGTFFAIGSYSAGDDPCSVTTGDFDEDGHTDLVVANVASDDVSILLGYGNGMFYPAVSYDTGGHSYSVTTGDFDENGHTDLAVANGNYNGNVSVLLGVGDGTFFPAVSYDAGYYSFSVAAGDFDEDGHTDLAVSNDYYSEHGSVSILLGLGNGTFAYEESYGVGVTPSSVTTGDFDEDGHTDLAVANSSSDNVSILINLTEEPTAVRDNPLTPAAYSLSSNYPNPFNPATTIKFSVAEAGHILIAVYDVTGRRVKLLVDRDFKRGEFETAWNGKNDHGEPVGSGVYFARMTAGGYKAVRKVVLIR